MIMDMIREKNLTKYRLSKISGIPYTTIQDITSGKARLEKCTAETIYRLARALDMTMEELLAPCFVERIDFELFKSNVCHRVKVLGDMEFIIETLEMDAIHDYYRKGWHPECFYLLAMLDYISNQNQVPLCASYDSIRRLKLEKPRFPASVLVAAEVMGDEAIKQKAIQNSIPEFLHFNLVESEVRNVV